MCKDTEICFYCERNFTTMGMVMVFDEECESNRYL